MLRMLKNASLWHKGDKWRNGSKLSRAAWKSHNNNLDQIIEEGL